MKKIDPFFCLIIAFVVAILSISAFTPNRNTQTIYYFSNDLNKVGAFINKWSALGFKIQSVTPQVISSGNQYNTYEGDLFVVMQK